MTEWRQIVRRHAAQTGAPDLPRHAIDELADHLEDIHRAAVEAGASEADARASALAALAQSPLAELTGSSRRLRTPRPASGPPGLMRTSPLRSLSMLHALRIALRQFRHHPTFALVTVLVLGLGTGAGVAVYTVVDTVLLQPLPYREPDRLLSLWDTNHEDGLSHEPMSPVNFMDYSRLDVFEGAAAWWRPDVNLTEAGADPVRVRTIETGGNLFKVLGVAPQIGPGFPEDGPLFSTDRIAVISDRLWRTRYQGDQGIIGEPLLLNGAPYTVVGVMPERFDFPGDIDVWQRSSWDFHNHSRGAHFMEGIARMAAGVTFETADAAATGLAGRLAAEFAATNRAWGIRLIPLVEEQLGYYRPALIVLFGAVGLLIVIGVLNVSSLLLTRALSREREVAVRTALGASPRHLIVQLIAEALVLAGAGAAVGTLAATLAVPLLIAATPVPIPRLAEAAVSPRVLGFALAVAMGSTVVFGLVPALALLRRNLAGQLKAGDRGSSRASGTLYRGLVAGEVALACALLISSGLLVRTVGRMTNVPIGVGRPEAVTASVQLTGAAYRDWTTVATVHGLLVERVRQQPGVRHAGASNFLPLDPGWRVPFAIEGRPPVPPSELPQAQYHSVTEGYFEAIGAPIRQGRDFAAQDGAQSAGVAIVNETFVRQFFPGEPPLGRVLLSTARGIGPLGRNIIAPPAPAPPPGPASSAPTGPTAPPLPPTRYEIVGVVADVKNVPLNQPTEPAVYLQARQFPFRSMSIAVESADRTTGTAAIQNALREIAPAVPLADTRTWADRFDVRTAEPRLLMSVLIAFAGLAAFLAALGVYGLFGWMVAMRQRELAIRLTLGARPSGVGLLIVRQGLILVTAGVVVGGVIVRLAEQMLTRVLFDVSPSDLSSTAAAAALLLVASLAACLVPAWRAMHIDPVEGLRPE